MKSELLDLLRCPESGQQLELIDAVERNGEIESGWLVTPDGKYRYPVKAFIPRFVPETNYADNFGMQWNKFRKTQLDSYSGHPISAERFWSATAWKQPELEGKWLLDAGCGSGRFAEVALNAGARVVALDYSNAVDACFANLGHRPTIDVVQCNIYALPFRRKAFPFVYSLGVLQHTPDVAAAVLALFPMVADGGRICIDFYENSWKAWLLPKYWLRPLTTKMSPMRLFSLLEYWVPRILPASRILGKVPLAGHQLKKVIPVVDYTDSLPLDDKQQMEWSLLDTFDALAPQFDNPQTSSAVKKWLEEGGFQNIEVLKAGHLVGRASMRSS